MKGLMTLESTEGETYFVNPEHIVWFTPWSSENGPEIGIRLLAGNTIIVRDTLPAFMNRYCAARGLAVHTNPEPPALPRRMPGVYGGDVLLQHSDSLAPGEAVTTRVARPLRSTEITMTETRETIEP